MQILRFKNVVVAIALPLLDLINEQLSVFSVNVQMPGLAHGTGVKPVIALMRLRCASGINTIFPAPTQHQSNHQGYEPSFHSLSLSDDCVAIVGAA